MPVANWFGVSLLIKMPKDKWDLKKEECEICLFANTLKCVLAARACASHQLIMTNLFHKAVLSDELLIDRERSLGQRRVVYRMRHLQENSQSFSSKTLLQLDTQGFCGLPQTAAAWEGHRLGWNPVTGSFGQGVLMSRHKR